MNDYLARTLFDSADDAGWQPPRGGPRLYPVPDQQRKDSP